MIRIILIALVTLLPATAVAAPPQAGPIDVNFQERVDKAIEKGAAYLNGKTISKPGGHQDKGDELVLLTLVHAEVPESNAHFKKLLDAVLTDKLWRTYRVALTAMILEEHDRVKYQWRIHQCAQFLVDNMDAEGCLRYGEETDLRHIPESVPTTRDDIATAGVSEANGTTPHPVALDGKPKVKNTIKVVQRRRSNQGHDMSNLQYAALGLRACHDSGIRFQTALLQASHNFWRKMQIADKNAKREPLILDKLQKGPLPPPGGTQAQSTYQAVPRGWGYQDSKRDYPYGSMTVGGIGALCILDYMMNKDWKKDPAVIDGLQWISKHFTVTENPEAEEYCAQYHYYYLYGLERAGMLFGTETIGAHQWYPEGAEYLLKEQNSNGSWGTKKTTVRDTCFAILFLKRATRSLKPVATGGR